MLLMEEFNSVFRVVSKMAAMSLVIDGILRIALFSNYEKTIMGLQQQRQKTSAEKRECGLCFRKNEPPDSEDETSRDRQTRIYGEARRSASSATASKAQSKPGSVKCRQFNFDVSDPWLFKGFEFEASTRKVTEGHGFHLTRKFFFPFLANYMMPKDTRPGIIQKNVCFSDLYT